MADIRQKIIAYISSAGSADLDQILSMFESKDHWLVEIHLANLLEEGALEAAAGSFSAKLAPDEIGARQEVPLQGVNGQGQIVVTVPENLLPMTASALSTRQAFRHIMGDATNTLFVSQPFIDNTFIDIFEDEIREMARNGVRFTLVTRKVSTDAISIRGLLRIYEMYALQSNESKFELYEHWVPLRTDADQQRQFVGLHAKLVINEKEAYVGSANWTGYSLSNNVEVGVLVRDGATLRQLRDLLSMVVTQSIRVDMKRIHQRLTYKASDANGH